MQHIASWKMLRNAYERKRVIGHGEVVSESSACAKAVPQSWEYVDMAVWVHQSAAWTLVTAGR